jgi:hypothetical protein
LKRNKLDYILTYLLVCVPGTLFFNARQLVFYAAFLFALITFFKRKRYFSKDFTRFILLIVLLLFIQTIKFKVFSTISAIGLFIAFLYPYFIAKAVGHKIIYLYIEIVYFLAILSLFFYIPSIISPVFHNSISKIPIALNTDIILYNQNFIIFTVESAKASIFGIDVLRNSGNFTEPGVFAVWIILALIINMVTNIVLIITLLSTFSTAGYITFAFIIFSFFVSTKKVYWQVIFVPIMLFLGTYIYNSFDFLKVKVDEQVNYQINAGSIEEKRGRFASLYKDLNEFKQHFVVGRGLIKQSRFDNLTEKDIALLNKDINDPRFSSLNGTSDLLLRLGIFGFLFYSILLYNFFLKLCSFYSRHKILALYAVLAIFLIMMSQRLTLNAPLVMLLFIFPFKRLKKEYLNIKDFGNKNEQLKIEYYNTKL